jgi:hypothetical protein
MSKARKAKRRYNVGAEKMRKNFSVGVLFQNDNSLPEWMFRVDGLERLKARIAAVQSGRRRRLLRGCGSRSIF